MARMRLSGEADMTQGNVWKLLFNFAVPMLLGLFLQQFYNTVDTIVVGRFVGTEALAAVGSTGTIVNFVVGLFAGISTGAGVVISQCYGAHDLDRLRDCVGTTTLVTAAMCLVSTPLGIAIVRPMLRLMDMPADVFPLADSYLTIFFAGLPGLMIYNMGSGVLRAVGDSKRPLYFLCFSAVVNIAADLIFVINFGLGVAGVAYATILSELLSAILVVFVLTKTDSPYRIPWKKLQWKKDILSQILSIGLPSGVQQSVTSFSNIFVQSYINFYGSACIAGWSAYSKLDIFLMIPMMSISLAVTTFVGQNYGARKIDRARKGVHVSFVMGLTVTGVLMVLMLVFQRPLLVLFSADDSVIAFGERFITLISPFYLITSLNQILGSALRGVGDAKTPMILMLSAFVVFRQLYLFVNKLLGDNFVVMALAYPAGWAVCGVLMILFYRKSVFCHPERLEAN